MKKITFLLTHTVVVMLTLLTAVKAQKRLTFNSPAHSNSFLSPFKEFGFAETKANAINIKAVRNFVKTFKTTSNNKWFLAADGTSTSIFTSDGITTWVTYDSKGNRLYILRIYQENEMAEDIRDRVKREYYDATITLVKELQTYEWLFIYVHLQDKDTLKMVRIAANGEMKLVDNFSKG